MLQHFDLARLHLIHAYPNYSLLCQQLELRHQAELLGPSWRLQQILYSQFRHMLFWRKFDNLLQIPIEASTMQNGQLLLLYLFSRHFYPGLCWNKLYRQSQRVSRARLWVHLRLIVFRLRSPRWQLLSLSQPSISRCKLTTLQCAMPMRYAWRNTQSLAFWLRQWRFRTITQCF